MNIKSIAIEGSDGAGKATTTELLKRHLSRTYEKIATISFPRYTETTGGMLCHEVLKGERQERYDFISKPPKIASLLYIMDRAESKDYIQKLLNENDILIFDRYISSNFIHQGGKISSDVEREELISFLEDLEYEKFALPKADITFFLHLPVEIAMRNKSTQRLEQTMSLERVKVDAGEDDLIYLENSNKAGLWCCEKLGWERIDCSFQYKEEQIQKDKGDIVIEIVRKLFLLQNS